MKIFGQRLALSDTLSIIPSAASKTLALMRIHSYRCSKQSLKSCLMEPPDFGLSSVADSITFPGN